ncbi:hypothetical protein L3Q82_003779 [Scortum barcoo]|uniref:Uncharacterized protein n=1 Tax=Scortum barcoo TaxID=214431 RepID=A0ACB8X5Y8_9TELE|nr:hypothetical protein L3Q82_003779 [Scortum barcoo]
MSAFYSPGRSCRPAFIQRLDYFATQQLSYFGFTDISLRPYHRPSFTSTRTSLSSHAGDTSTGSGCQGHRLDLRPNPHCTRPKRFLLRVMGLMEDGPMSLLRAGPGRAPWAKARPPGGPPQAWLQGRAFRQADSCDSTCYTTAAIIGAVIAAFLIVYVVWDKKVMNVLVLLALRIQNCYYAEKAAGDVILVSPPVPVMEGDSVSLHCRDKMAASSLPADFYKDGLLSVTGYKGNFTISTVSKSHEGLYKCSISGAEESAESWLAVRAHINLSPEENQESPESPSTEASPNLAMLLPVVFTIFCVAVLLVVGILYCWKHRVSGEVADPHMATYAVVRKPQKKRAPQHPLAQNSKMLCLKNGLFLKSLIFQPIVVIFLTNSCGGQSPSIVLVGEDIILPCHLDPGADAVSMILEWGRPDLKPRFVHVWHEGQNLLVNQNPSYKGRTSVSMEGLKQGDLSLKLSKVKLSDSGTYRCFVPELSRESTVQLTVGSASSPIIAGINITSNTGILHCESKGWYPEPEVLWLDGEGNLLSAGPPETVRGPDDLYTVSSRVTVEKRHSNRFTCRVQQKNINQTREAHIQFSGFIVSDECSAVSSNSAAHISIILAVVFICVLAVLVIVWKWRQNKTNIKMHQEEEAEQTEQKEQLMVNSKSKEDSDEKNKKLNEKKKKEEKQKDFLLVVNLLKEETSELKTLREKICHQKEDMEREKDENEKQVQSVEEETIKDRVNGYWKLRDIITDDQKKMKNRKQEYEKLLLHTDKVLIRAEKALREIKLQAEKEEVEVEENQHVT